MFGFLFGVGKEENGEVGKIWIKLVQIYPKFFRPNPRHNSITSTPMLPIPSPNIGNGGGNLGLEMEVFWSLPFPPFPTHNQTAYPPHIESPHDLIISNLTNQSILSLLDCTCPIQHHNDVKMVSKWCTRPFPHHK